MGFARKNAYDDPYQDALQRTLGGSPGTSNTMPITDAANRTPISANLPGTSQTGKRDQWSGSGSVTTRGNFGNLEGFDAGNFGDDGMQTAKYQAGRIFSRFNPDDANALNSILNDPEFKGLFPNARGVGPDKIDFGDGRPVDVIRGHGAPGAKFSWQTMDDATVPGSIGGRPLGLGGAPVWLGQQSDLMAQILASLQAQQPDAQALLQQTLR